MPDPSPDTPSVCPAGDPTCPCPDGLACHYQAVDDSPALTPPSPSVCPDCGSDDPERIEEVEPGVMCGASWHPSNTIPILSVCPTCGSRTRFVAYGKCDPQSKPFGWIDPWHNVRPAPAAPGSSSPDTAALVERLHDITRSIWRGGEFHYQLVLEQCGDIVAAADALEAQAARITELEAHNRRLAGTMTGDTAVDLRVLYAYELGIADHPQTPTEESP